MSVDVSTIKELNAFHLSSMADCAKPDSLTSAGACFLLSVRSGIIELVEDLEELPDDVQELDDDGSVHQIADNAPDVLTYRRWMEFCDLAAWQEDPTDFRLAGDMTEQAGVCLYVIADRLAWALLELVGGRVGR